MKIIDEILPKVKAGVRLDKDNKTLWIKTDTLEGYGRIIIEDGANWCRIFYEECGECAHNDAEQTEPTISKMEQVEDDAYFLELMGAVERGEISDAGANQAWYEYINHKDEPQTEPLPKAINGVKIADAVAWADKWLEDNPVSEMWDMIRTLRDATEWQGEPQTDCAWR